ncbi:hypothetical protein VP01_478g2 [Puccinia sorghi]|uniref:Uncharacterized protein n=1 Tax=Puccinia sorghi TaxID=27349 RepID=A0A0L6UMN7_9BASI|nr:hypothetical protein VP01_478g2 [Puccinia sorghi]
MLMYLEASLSNLRQTNKGAEIRGSPKGTSWCALQSHYCLNFLSLSKPIQFRIHPPVPIKEIDEQGLCGCGCMYKQVTQGMEHRTWNKIIKSSQEEARELQNINNKCDHNLKQGPFERVIKGVIELTDNNKDAIEHTKTNRNELKYTAIRSFYFTALQILDQLMSAQPQTKENPLLYVVCVIDYVVCVVDWCFVLLVAKGGIEFWSLFLPSDVVISVLIPHFSVRHELMKVKIKQKCTPPTLLAHNQSHPKMKQEEEFPMRPQFVEIKAISLGEYPSLEPIKNTPFLLRFAHCNPERDCECSAFANATRSIVGPPLPAAPPLCPPCSSGPPLHSLWTPWCSAGPVCPCSALRNNSCPQNPPLTINHPRNIYTLPGPKGAVHRYKYPSSHCIFTIMRSSPHLIINQIFPPFIIVSIVQSLVPLFYSHNRFVTVIISTSYPY